MAFSTEQAEDLTKKISAKLASGRLNNWQTKFLTDMKDRFAQYNTGTRLTDKQLHKLYEIIGSPRPLGGAKPNRPYVVASTNRTHRQPARKWRPRKRSSVFSREARWFIKRFSRSVLIAAVLIVGSGIYSLVKKDSLPFADFVESATDVGGLELSVPLTSYLGSAKAIAVHQFSVTDGDTVKVFGESKGTRLVGFNTPETYRPRCTKERVLGEQATKRLKELIATSSIDLKKVPCACKPGTGGTDACNFGRSCGILYVDGRNVGEILISEGLAVPFNCGATSCPRMPRPWCN